MIALNEVNKMVLASYGSSSCGRQYDEDETVSVETLVVKRDGKKSFQKLLSRLF